MEDGSNFKWKGMADDARHADGLAGAQANEETGQQILRGNEISSKDGAAIEIGRFLERGTQLRALNDSKPSDSFNGWADFLSRECEIRDILFAHPNDVIFFGTGDRNYFLFPSGEIFECNNGEKLMSMIRKLGTESALQEIREVNGYDDASEVLQPVPHM